ncbi:putative porin [Methylotenera sp.]|uniref:putative porin n=1 Tax=Methylotenera sp. TaxID=2051956 RepID=UPI002486D7D9|nr:putative porin [Methylotenera sp.]MDI1299007.1 putative porin [Methylotenera sp.]
MNFIEYEIGVDMKKLPLFKAHAQDFQRSHLSGLNTSSIIATIAAVMLGTSVNSAQAGERESLEQLRSTTTNLVNLLVQEGVLSKDKAGALLKQAAQDAEKAKEIDAAAAPASTSESVDAAIDKKMVRVQYVPDIVKKQMKEEIKDEVMTTLNYKAGERLGMPEWIDRLKWEGSLRLRAEADKYPEGNPIASKFNSLNGTKLNNTTEDRNRLRVRAQLGVKADINDWMTAGIRMTTGSLDDPISPNQTQEAASGKYTIGLDRAYMNAKIKPWLNVVGGRFANPWFSTDLMWDPDLAFDGIAASFTPAINDRLSGFVTLGAFPIDEIEKSDLNQAKSKWMYGSQAGINWKFSDKSSAKFGVALYDFQNVEGISNVANGFTASTSGPFSATVPAFRTKGNSTFDINGGVSGTEQYGLSSKFRDINITGQIDLAQFDPVHIILTGDYIRNIGFDSQEIAQRTTGGDINSPLMPKKQVNAYQLKVAVGMLETYQKGQWNVFAAYKRLEADSVLDSFTDSDFYLGGTNAKGWLLGGSYGLDKNTWLTARWFSADEISPRSSGVVGEAPLSPLSVDVLMLDLNTKF